MRLRFFMSVSLLLLALTACGGSKGNTAASVSLQHASVLQVQITESDFHISSSLTSFTAGETYHFVVTNKGKATHEFMIMSQSARGMDDIQNMDRMALAMLDDLDPGQTRALNYTFPISAAGSHPEFACHEPGHYAAGMKLSVMVTAPGK